MTNPKTLKPLPIPIKPTPAANSSLYFARHQQPVPRHCRVPRCGPIRAHWQFWRRRHAGLCLLYNLDVMPGLSRRLKCWHTVISWYHELDPANTYYAAWRKARLQLAFYYTSDVPAHRVPLPTKSMWTVGSYAELEKFTPFSLQFYSGQKVQNFEAFFDSIVFVWHSCFESQWSIRSRELVMYQWLSCVLTNLVQFGMLISEDKFIWR